MPSCPDMIHTALHTQAVTYKGTTPGEQLAHLFTADEHGVPRLQVWRDKDEWATFVDVGSSSGAPACVVLGRPPQMMR